MSTAASAPLSDPPLVVVMGVSGCGKTSVGAGIAARLATPFIEGDTFHPESNVAKMSAGIPLDDADRWPWLDRIGKAIADARRAGLVVSCSALKAAYRDRLRAKAGGRLFFVFLSGSRELLRTRLAERRGHFMPPSLLDSQFAALEDPSGEADVATLDIAVPVADLVDAAVLSLEAVRASPPYLGVAASTS